jgi:hypothetical protein
MKAKKKHFFRKGEKPFILVFVEKNVNWGYGFGGFHSNVKRGRNG